MSTFASLALSATDAPSPIHFRSNAHNMTVCTENNPVYCHVSKRRRGNTHVDPGICLVPDLKDTPH